MQVDKIVDKKYVTKNSKETQKLGYDFASVIARSIATKQSRKGAVVIGLSGNLGGGKTTFLQGLAKGLKIKQKILSPTFVIYKKFKIPKFVFYKSVLTDVLVEKHFYHFDCYRLKNEKDILELGWKEIIKNPENIVAIEWPEKIKKVLPKNTIYIEFKFIDEHTREIKINAKLTLRLV